MLLTHADGVDTRGDDYTSDSQICTCRQGIVRHRCIDIVHLLQVSDLTWELHSGLHSHAVDTRRPEDDLRHRAHYTPQRDGSARRILG